MTQSTNRLGRIGEDLATRHLEAEGFRILERNWRASLADVRGEVDIIATEGRCLVFCEVKSRRQSVAVSAFAAVDWRKQTQLRRLAAIYLASHHCGDVRFDVVAVAWPPAGGSAEITHIRGAF